MNQTLYKERRIEFKEKAKRQLQGKYRDAIKLLFVSALIGIIPGIITGIGQEKEIVELVGFGYILSALSSAIIGFGTLSFFIKVSRNEEVTYKEIFAKKEMFMTFLLLSTIIEVLTTFFTIFLVVPGIIAALAYSQAMYIQLDNPEKSVLDCIQESKTLMNGHKEEYILLGLSFLGWIILGVFTLGILYFWLIPYISVTQANFYNSLVQKNK